MKKLITLLVVASLALTIQAQDITNTLGTDGSFFVNKLGGTPSFLKLSSTGDHIMQFSTASTGFTIKGQSGDALFSFSEQHNAAPFTMLTVGHADANWLGSNTFAHLQLQSQTSAIPNKFNMVARSAVNNFNAYSANGTGTSPEASTNNHIILNLYGYGYQNSANRLAAGISFVVDGTPAGNFVPGKITFHTTSVADGSTIRMTVKNDGKVGIGTDAPTSTLDVAGSVSLSYNETPDAAYTATATDYTIIPIDVCTVTLPDPSTCEGRVYVVKRPGTGNSISIVSAGTDVKIDGHASVTLDDNWDFIKVQSVGFSAATTWVIIGGNGYTLVP